MNKWDRDLEIGKRRRSAVSDFLQILGRDKITIAPLAEKGFQVTHNISKKAKLNTMTGRGAGDSPFNLGLTFRITDLATQKYKDFEIRIFSDFGSCSSSYLKTVSGKETIADAIAPFQDRCFLNLFEDHSFYSIVPIELLKGRMTLNSSKGNKNRISIDTNGFEPRTPVTGRQGIIEVELDIISAIRKEINK
jgi:hypothetical protein